jgi:hypothetical protein
MADLNSFSGFPDTRVDRWRLEIHLLEQGVFIFNLVSLLLMSMFAHGGNGSLVCLSYMWFFNSTCV